MYRAIAVANYFLKISFETKDKITHLKLQKLVFLAHAWHLAIYEEPLILERIEAWRYGPVISDLYHEFKDFKNKHINRYGTIARRSNSDSLHKFEALLRSSDSSFNLVIPHIDDEDTRTIDHLNETWDVHKDFTAGQLSAVLHEKGSPWEQTWTKHYPEGDSSIVTYGLVVIDDNIIKDFYKKLGEGNNAH